MEIARYCDLDREEEEAQGSEDDQVVLQSDYLAQDVSFLALELDLIVDPEPIVYLLPPSDSSVHG